MPLYEYQCQRCGKRIEKIQSWRDEPLTVCEACGGPLEKLISSPAIQFKGTGWYVTDYAHKSGAPANGGEKKSDAANKPGDAKPAPAAETKPSASAPAKKE